MLIINSHSATVVPMMQLVEFRYIVDFTGIAVRTNNSEFSPTKEDIVQKNLYNRNNKGEIGGIK
jgi:hypothetical protein